MTEHVPVELGAVQETLLIPLYARAVETRRGGGLLADPRAVEMVEAIDYNFARFDQPATLVGAVLRTVIFDGWVRDFLAAHPAGTVVEIGAGLNTRFERVDNGRLHWVDLDLPDAIELRRRFFTDSERRRIIAGSILEPDWVETVKQFPPPYFVAIEAVLLYLAEDEVRSALRMIGARFPGASVAFDTGGKFMVNGQKRHPTMKFMAARMRWACDDPREVERWETGLRLRDTLTYAQAPRALRRRLPPTFRYLLPVLRVLFPPLVTTYRLNLYNADPE